MRKKGFTLIELLAVIGIISIFFSFGLPSLNRLSNQLYLHSSARLIAAEIRWLQNQALLKHLTTTLDLGRICLPPGIKIVKSSGIKFAATGYPPPGGSGSILLENHLGQIKKIIVSSSGRVRIE